MQITPGSSAASSVVYCGCHAYKTADVALSSATWTNITFGAEFFDTDTIHDNATNPSRFTVPTGKGGKWRFTIIAMLGGGLTPNVQFAIAVNGTRASPNPGSAIDAETATGSAFVRTVEAVLSLSAGDYVEWQLNPSAGTNIYSTASGDSYATRAIFERIGD